MARITKTVMPVPPGKAMVFRHPTDRMPVKGVAFIEQKDGVAGKIQVRSSVDGVNYDDEIVGFSVGASGSTNYPGTFGPAAARPIVPGSVTITDGVQVVTDDGAGNLIGDIQAGTNTVDYSTGAFDVTFASTTGGAVTANWRIDDLEIDNVPGGIVRADFPNSLAPRHGFTKIYAEENTGGEMLVEMFAPFSVEAATTKVEDLPPLSPV